MKTNGVTPSTVQKIPNENLNSIAIRALHNLSNSLHNIQYQESPKSIAHRELEYKVPLTSHINEKAASIRKRLIEYDMQNGPTNKLVNKIMNGMDYQIRTLNETSNSKDILSVVEQISKIDSVLESIIDRQMLKDIITREYNLFSKLVKKKDFSSHIFHYTDDQYSLMIRGFVNELNQIETFFQDKILEEEVRAEGIQLIASDGYLQKLHSLCDDEGMKSDTLEELEENLNKTRAEMFIKAQEIIEILKKIKVNTEKSTTCNFGNYLIGMIIDQFKFS